MRVQFRWETVKKALCCLMAVCMCGTAKSPLEAKRRGEIVCQSRFEVRMKSSRRLPGEMPRTHRQRRTQTKEEIL